MARVGQRSQGRWSHSTTISIARGCQKTHRGAAFPARLARKTAWEGRPTVAQPGFLVRKQDVYATRSTGKVSLFARLYALGAVVER
jgi:hypothetical protein